MIIIYFKIRSRIQTINSVITRNHKRYIHFHGVTLGKVQNIQRKRREVDKERRRKQ